MGNRKPKWMPKEPVQKERVRCGACPCCGSEERLSQGEDTTYDTSFVTCQSRCYDCGARWVEEYRLVRVYLEEGDKAEHAVAMQNQAATDALCARAGGAHA